MVDFKVFGQHDKNTIKQMAELVQYGSVEKAALMADGHFGYNMPVGGVVGYSEHISPSGVGFDIGCGVKAVKTNLTYGDLKQLGVSSVADQIAAKINFGMGGRNEARSDHDLFDADAWSILLDVAGRHAYDKLFSGARKQLGTVGGGNHYVDVLIERNHAEPKYLHGGLHSPDDPVWIMTHFGSRGFGHGVATGFIKIAEGYKFDQNMKGLPQLKSDMYEGGEPALLETATDMGRAYQSVMELGGRYAYAGRDIVVQQVLDILGGEAIDTVHNHHNYSFTEHHGGRELQVTRKGATPLAPGQRGAVGGSMCDIAVIVKGKEADLSDMTRAHPSDLMTRREQEATLMSTVHGAGRVMSRNEAKGKRKYRTNELILNEDGTPKKAPAVSEEMMAQSVKDYGIELRGGFLDESAFCYRPLKDVLAAHANTAEVETVLRPVIVCMAPSNIVDPFKD